MLLEGIQGFAMPSGPPKIDNAPLDPGGQEPGPVTPPGAHMGTTAGAAPPAPPEACTTVPQSEGFVPSLEINPEGHYPSLEGAILLQRAPKAPGKRLQDHSPDGLGRAPMKSLFGPAQRGMEATLIGQLTSANSALITELAAIKAYMTSYMEGLEQRITARLGAIENRFEALEAQRTRPNAPNHAPGLLMPGGSRQGWQQPPPPHDTTFTDVAHGPPANPNEAAKPTAPSRASPPISKRPPPTKPAAQAAPRPAGPPQWVEIAAANPHEWQTITKKRQARPNKLPKVQADPGSLKPIRSSNKEDRRLIFRRQKRTAPKQAREDIILYLNRYLAQAGFPGFARVADANYTDSGAISVLLEQGTTATALLPAYMDPLVAACHWVDPAVISVEPNQQWHKLKVHAVPVARYSASGLTLAQEEIELGGTCTLMRTPTWIKPLTAIQATGQRFSTIVITVGSLEDARRLLPQGIRFGGNMHPVTPYYDVGKDSVCTRCCGIGHRAYRACGTRPELCLVCAGPHEARDHACNVLDCTSKTGHPCLHTPTKCGNCGRGHQADSPSCPKLREIRRRSYKRLPGIEVVMPPPPPEWEAREGINEEDSRPVGPEGPLEEQGQEPIDEDMGDAIGTALPSSPLPYSSLCPEPTLGTAPPINVDYSA